MQGVFTFADGWLNFFLRLLYHLGYRISRLQFKIFLPADSSVSIDWPTLHAFGRAGRRPFCRDFFVENGKIFVGKNGASWKNFCGSKIFSWVNFWCEPKRGLALWALGRASWAFCTTRRVVKTSKRLAILENSYLLGRNSVASPPSANGRSRFFKSDLFSYFFLFFILLKSYFYIIAFSFISHWIADRWKNIVKPSIVVSTCFSLFFAV